MNVKTWIPLAIAVVLGLVAAKVARDSVAREREAGRRQVVKNIQIAVAKVPVSPGQELTAELLTLGPIASELPPPRSFTDPGPLVGRVAAAPLLPGQPVTEDLLAAKGAAAGLQALVPRGMRAITIDVTDTTGLAGMILPGARVDVVSSISGATRADMVARTIVQDVLVQAVGQRLTATRSADNQGTPEAVRTVTLIATPRQAEAIELASSTGKVRLVLRGPDDRETAHVQGVTLAELLGQGDGRTQVVRVPEPELQPPPTTRPTTQPAVPDVPPGVGPVDPFASGPVPPAEKPKVRRTVTLIRGGTRTEVVFETEPEKRNDAPAVTRTPQDPVGQ